MNKSLKNKTELKNLSSLFLSAVLVLWLLVASVLIGLAEDIVTTDSIVNFNNRWSDIFLSLHSTLGTSIFSGLTVLGNWQIVLPALFLIVYLLFIKNKKIFVAPFIFTVVSAEAITFIAKIVIHRPRPLYAMITETDFSFPSGHATIAVAFYGYLAYIFIKSFKSKIKRLVIFLGALLIISVIGFSRLYLGVHYVSDVIAGYLVGLLALIAGISLSEWLSLKSSQKSKR